VVRVPRLREGELSRLKGSGRFLVENLRLYFSVCSVTSVAEKDWIPVPDQVEGKLSRLKGSGRFLVENLRLFFSVCSVTSVAEKDWIPVRAGMTSSESALLTGNN